MNDDDLEKKLHALTGTLRRPDPTPAWKMEILARARREATVTPIRQTLPPRWLMLGWAAAWVAILTLNFLTPQDAGSNNIAGRSIKPSQSMSTPSREELSALIAFNQRQYLNLELP